MDDNITTFITRSKVDFIGPGPWATFYGGINSESDLFKLDPWDRIDLTKQLGIYNLVAITDLIIEGNLIIERLKEDGLVH